MNNAPELELARSELLVTERTLLAARRSLSIPTVALVGEYRKRIAKDGAGVDQLDFTIPGTGEKIGGITDEVEWNAALTADLPLYAGGGRLARIQSANADVNQARLLVDETQLNIRAQLLRQYYQMIASLKNIEYARIASDAGANNLELVVESYASGVVTIIDLLDAQLAALTSALDAANAEYDFLIEYFRLQRISGNFDLLMEVNDRDQMRSDLQSRLR
jgi:outer membrane protein TolC